MEYDCGFNTKLLHGKTSKGFPNREILPPISQVTAFRYDSMEELERVFCLDVDFIISLPEVCLPDKLQ